MATVSEVETARFVAAVLDGNRRALGRVISAIENGDGWGAQVANVVAARAQSGRIVGITGPPGAGKSSLVGSLVDRFRERGLRVGVLLVDPSSPETGGAVLGDRVRMTGASREGTFVRSLASRGHLGGLTRLTPLVVGLIGAAGMDIVVVETVGGGQADVAIAECVDHTVLICPPGLGDDVQAAKAGTMEIADSLVVSKADLEGSVATVRDLQAMVLHSTRPNRSVNAVSARTGDGVEELADALLAKVEPAGDGAVPMRIQHVLRSSVHWRVASALQGLPPIVLEELASSVVDEELDIGDAGKELIRRILPLLLPTDHTEG